MATKTLLVLSLATLLAVVVDVAAVPGDAYKSPYGFIGACPISGFLKGQVGKCNPENNSTCCAAGQLYPQHRVSPPVGCRTPAAMTLNSFEACGDGGGPSLCDGLFHNNTELIVALSTGWFGCRSRCGKYIEIRGNGRSVFAKVVDECDSVSGCDADHNFEPPCRCNIVDASAGVWEALGIDKGVGEYNIVWSDA